ncbi:MAG: peptidase domain-containing ABC transporter [Bacteroidales bacterium]|nr:peptidase domain-containing ABC transporter [Bacteroidales bacterium]
MKCHHRHRFPTYRQFDSSDCGPTCLRMIARYYGKKIDLQTLRERCFMTRDGVSMLGISNAAESVGFRPSAVRASFGQLCHEVSLPCIVHWKQCHFVVVYCIAFDKGGCCHVYVADPARGRIRYTQHEFLTAWLGEQYGNDQKGPCLMLEPLPAFFERTDTEERAPGAWRFLFGYLRSFMPYVLQLWSGFVVTALIAFAVPFLTQIMVDQGIEHRNLSLLTTILLALLAMSFGQAAIDFLRGWVTLHLSMRINLAVTTDFLVKLMRLPIAFFERRMTGDIIQRMDDNHRIQDFLTSTAMNAVFSLGMLVILGIIIACYDLRICAVYFAFSTLYILWILLFLSRRREIDNHRFALSSMNRNTTIQLLTNMPDIKMNQCEQYRRQEWVRGQSRLFKLSMKGLMVSQYQGVGALFINSSKNFVITYMAATSVMTGRISLGMMLSIQYIIGQLNGPVNALVHFIQHWQDASLSSERLQEVMSHPAEDERRETYVDTLPPSRSIQISGLSFQYEGPHTEYALRNLNLMIPEGKVTALVGGSGSGKTTLLKLLMGYYMSYQGDIKIGEIPLPSIHPQTWRRHIGAVLQDSPIFYDTVANNIAMKEQVDPDRLANAVRLANLQACIDEMPSGLDTIIGNEGRGLSQGQKQRILLARVVYRAPDYIFLDEATNSLDACNEGMIMDNLQHFFHGRTVVIAAHRLSTIKHAHHIVVLDKGLLAEQGTHEMLLANNGIYCNLVKNQLG